MLFEVVQERMPRAEEPRARAMPREHVAVIGTGNLAHEVACFHDDGILIGVMMAPQRAVADEADEKSGEAERFVITDGFEMATQGLGANIDAEYGLCLRPHLLPRYFLSESP